MGRIGLHLGRVRALEVADIAGVLNQRHMHTQANTEEGNTLLTGIADGFDLALNAAIAEATRHKNRVELRQQANALRFNFLCIDVIDLNAGISLQAGVIQSLVQ